MGRLGRQLGAGGAQTGEGRGQLADQAGSLGRDHGGGDEALAVAEGHQPALGLAEPFAGLVTGGFGLADRIGDRAGDQPVDQTLTARQQGLGQTTGVLGAIGLDPQDADAGGGVIAAGDKALEALVQALAAAALPGTGPARKDVGARRSQQA